MGNIGAPRRIQKEVRDLVKRTGCWDPEIKFGDAIKIMANFCIFRKGDFKEYNEKWKNQKKKT